MNEKLPMEKLIDAIMPYPNSSDHYKDIAGSIIRVIETKYLDDEKDLIRKCSFFKILKIKFSGRKYPKVD